MKEEQSKQDVRALFHFFSRNIREQLLALPLEADGMAGNDEEEMEEIAREFALQLRRLLLREQNEAQITPKELDDLKEFQGSKSEKVKNKENRIGFEGKRILVVGLGNAFVTPDALGPRTAGKLKVTRHLDGQFGKGFCQERNLPLLSAINTLSVR